MLGDGQTIRYAFRYAGTKYVQLVVTDAWGNSDSATQAITVTSGASPSPTATPVAGPPSASFDYSPSNPQTGAPVAFDGSGSTCAATPCSYHWHDVGPDGSDDYALGDGPAIGFTFRYVGTKYVQLVVTDALGRSDSATQAISVTSGAVPAPTPTPTRTPTPTPTATPTPPTTPTPPIPGACLATLNCYPKPQNSGVGATGVPDGHSPEAGCTTRPSSGQVLTDCLFSGGVTITTTGSGATYRFSDFHGMVTHSGSGTLTVEYSNFGPTSGCQDYDNSFTGGNYTLRYSRFNTHVSEGPRVSAGNIDIEENFIGPMCSNPGDHADGIQGYGGGTNVFVRHNTIDERTANDVTSPIFFADSSQSAQVEDNLVAGGGYSLRLHDDFTPDHGPWTLLRNRIVNGAWDFGPMNNEGTSFTALTCLDNRLVTIDAGYNVTSLGSVVSCSS